MRNLIPMLALALTLLGGCIDDDGDECTVAGGPACIRPEARACFARTPTITTGAYGCTLTTVDVGPQWTSALPGRGVDLYMELPAGLTATTVSDSIGFYELTLAPGNYTFCLPGGRSSCSQTFTFTEGTPLAVDVHNTAITLWQAR